MPDSDAMSTQESEPAARPATHPAELTRACQRLAERRTSEPDADTTAHTQKVLVDFLRLGLLTAPFPVAMGGMGLGVEPGTHLSLLRLLTIVGFADLATGRILEGHVNAVLLLHRYGTQQQLARLAGDARGGMLMGVWNTGAPEPLRLHRNGTSLRFEGVKTFATGAEFVRRPVVTAELEGTGWQMTVPRMESLDVAIDRSFWRPLGMESSESFQVDFTGCRIAAEDLIGAGGDFYRDPMFRGGAIRFAAVQAGGVLRLHSMYAAWLRERSRMEDPYHVQRLGVIATLAQECVLWVEKVAALAEQCFYAEDSLHVEHMLEGANMMRTAMEEKATRVMRLVTAGVGAHGLLEPHQFAHVVRDLTMYLRQPSPDQAVADIGRASSRKERLRFSGAAWAFWSADALEASLPAQYFEHIYRSNRDPWQFETSSYEHAKYDVTLNNLPRERYARALEIGCSIGVLTARLATRCEFLLALDISQLALDEARRRLAGTSHVQFARMQAPEELPDGPFDLIVVSEVGYYWSAAELQRATTRLAERQPPGGHLVLVHFTEFVPEYPQTGDAVHEAWLSCPEWMTVHSERHPRFRLEVLERLAPGQSPPAAG